MVYVGSIREWRVYSCKLSLAMLRGGMRLLLPSQWSHDVSLWPLIWWAHRSLSKFLFISCVCVWKSWYCCICYCSHVRLACSLSTFCWPFNQRWSQVVCFCTSLRLGSLASIIKGLGIENKICDTAKVLKTNSSWLNLQQWY
jgi:hypothetical protein